MQSFPQCTGWIRIYRGRVRCIPCRRFLYTIQLISGSEPRIGAAFADKFYRNPQGRRAFIKQSHGTPPHDLIEWIKTMLQNEESHLRSHSSETEQGIADNSEVKIFSRTLHVDPAIRTYSDPLVLNHIGIVDSFYRPYSSFFKIN